MAGHGPELAEFTGTWKMARRIEDLRAKAQGILTGRVVFSPDGAGRLICEESGEVAMAGHPTLAAGQCYIWRAGRGGSIEVLFADGRYFHRIAPGLSMPNDTHLCGDDLYHVAYDFTGWPGWGATWRVVGPQKDYRLVTRYARCAREG